MCAENLGQSLESMVAFELRFSCAHGLEARRKVIGWPVCLIADHQMKKVERRLWKPLVDIGFIESMYGSFGECRAFQPGTDLVQRFRERVLC